MRGLQAIALVVIAVPLLGGGYLMSNSGTPSLLNESVAVRSKFSITHGGASNPEYLSDLHRRADSGDPDAQLELAGYLTSGEGLVKRNLAKAEQFYHSAAKGGVGEAATELATIYWLKKDASKALEWSQKAVDLGDGSAAAVAGWWYLRGDNVAASQPEAAKWFEKGAQKGDFSCQYFLGRMHEEGLGIPVNHKAAYFWCRLSAEGSHSPARRAIERIRQQLTPVELTEADKQVVNWLKEHQ
jgi:TPR repeat protein